MFVILKHILRYLLVPTGNFVYQIGMQTEYCLIRKPLRRLG